jgi:peptidoglycan/LPS O-acetylase OafA/YrhL
MEAIFYLILPFTAWFFFKNRWYKTLPVLLILTLGWMFLTKHSLTPLVKYLQYTVVRYNVPESTIRYFLSQQFPGHLFTFGIGLTLANLALRYEYNYKVSKFFSLLTSKKAAWVFISLGILIILVPLYLKISELNNLTDYYFSHIVPAVGLGLILGGLVFGSQGLKAVLSFYPLRFIGLIGYSVYLWHMPLIYLFNSNPLITNLPAEQRFVPLLLFVTISLIILGSGFYLAIEKPFMIMGKRAKGSR